MRCALIGNPGHEDRYKAVRHAKHFAGFETVNHVVRALDHKCIATRVYTFAHTVYLQRHESKYGGAGTVHLIPSAPTSRLDPVLWGARARGTHIT